ncbi:MAG: hypothetical protein A2293_14225 [Elusimicrobia bacterium RIFOXYB2_FULL_49_7]|nr:MAG: hypothetical protein A2293_14225 [Elusimicrobia bacterium RIFOXYB2_FULL_49_7]
MAFNILFKRYPALLPLKKDILRVNEIICSALLVGNKVLLAGNGGSASDCDHFAGELLKNFMQMRPLPKKLQAALKRQFGTEGMDLANTLQYGLPAIPLHSFTGFLTAYGNDLDFDLAYAQLVQALGKKDDVLICFTTSGHSKNLITAAQMAKVMDIKVVGFTGRGGGAVAGLCDAFVNVEGSNSFTVQEWHLPIYHAICLEAEERLVRKLGQR